jgi:hypothetical protein
MSSKQKVNELINMLEKACQQSPEINMQEGFAGIVLNDEITFSYYGPVGLIMFYGEIWYTDEERVDRVSDVNLPDMREKLIQLVDNFYIDIKEIERMVFRLL